MQISPSIRYGVIALVAALMLGLLWFGVYRYQAEQRAISFASVSSSSVDQQSVTTTEQQLVPSEPARGLSDESQACSSGVEVSDPEPLLQVHVAGAVLAPGVYQLSVDARVADAIAAAGGSLPEGVPDALNLASTLADGDKIYVYTDAELMPAAPAAPAAQGATHTPVSSRSGDGRSGGEVDGAGLAAADRININTATAAELERIRGIGPVTAQAIIAFRATNGPFVQVEDLIRVKNIGPATLEKLRPHITL